MRALPALATLAALALSGCWKLDAEDLDTETLPFTPDVGAPEGWLVQSFDAGLTCPDGEPARFWMVYPESATVETQGVKPALPLAILFHSGSFDFVFTPQPGDPVSGTTFQEQAGGANRLTSDWAATRVLATLGLYPNYARTELHAGALPAALATKGIAMMLPENCWGDYWHNRAGIAENNYQGDFFTRRGRTAAEFAYLYATTDFPPGNPVELPIDIDPERLFLVGLGEGSRAVGELLTLRDGDGEDAPFAYPALAAVLDSPTDDLRVYYEETDSQTYLTLRSGLNRIFSGTPLLGGAMAAVPTTNFPSRTAVLTSTNDSVLPPGVNDVLFDRIDQLDPPDAWIYEDITPQHVLTNADPVLAKAVADYLAEGLEGLDPAFLPE